jgi:hypothetical protein
MRLLLACVVFGWLAAPVLAQVPTQTGTRIEIMRVSAPTVVVATVTLTVAEIVCNLAPTPAVAVTVNPLQAEWTDQDLPARVCRGSLSAALTALAPDQYVARASFVYSDGSVGLASANSGPFTRFNLATPQGLKLVK